MQTITRLPEELSIEFCNHSTSEQYLLAWKQQECVCFVWSDLQMQTTSFA